MSFERINNCIKYLSDKDSITLDLLFDMMVCMSQDVMSYNNALELSNTPVGDKSVLLKKLFNLMNMMLSVYEKNKDDVSLFSTSIQERYIKLVDEMNKALLEIKEVKQEIENSEAKEAELRTECEKLQVTRGHLLEVYKECEELQKQIDFLSDPFLDEKAREKNELEKELDSRRELLDSLEKNSNEAKTKLDELKEKIDKLNSSISELDEENQRLEDEENELLVTKNGLEKGLENIKSKLKEYKEWIDNYPNMSEQITNEFDEIKEKVLLIINSINSAISEDYLKENLFSVSNNSDVFDVENYPDCNVAETHFETIQELQEWFEEMNERIDSLIKIYEKMLVTLIEQSDKITIEQNL